MEIQQKMAIKVSAYIPTKPTQASTAPLPISVFAQSETVSATTSKNNNSTNWEKCAKLRYNEMLVRAMRPGLPSNDPLADNLPSFMKGADESVRLIRLLIGLVGGLCP